MITQIDIQQARAIVSKHLRREVANEAIALGKILTDLARIAENAVPIDHKKDVLRAAGWTEHKTGNWSEVEGATDAMPLDRAYGLVMSAPYAAPFDVGPRRRAHQDADDTVGVRR